MSLKKSTMAAVLAVSMASTPVLAQSATSAAPVVAARSGASADDSSELRGGFIIPLIAVVAIILGIIAAVHKNNNAPHSP